MDRIWPELATIMKQHGGSELALVPGIGPGPPRCDIVAGRGAGGRWPAGQYRGDPVGIEAIPLALGLAGYRAIARGLIVGLAGRMR
jgi:hypothetical protein